ncbi:hypothetical protein PIB30_002725 [Stylosanthes scabra]|uniref:Uncharacterized protein n=1 Tax=Stylosanthes scabra TaxID=79078 RepID=A0ABU6R3P7_9FABA|nr:hypothetical protein [Stylosanthes scabra]
MEIYEKDCDFFKSCRDNTLQETRKIPAELLADLPADFVGELPADSASHFTLPAGHFTLPADFKIPCTHFKSNSSISLLSPLSPTELPWPPPLPHRTVVDGAINGGVTHISLLCRSSLLKLRSPPSSAPPSSEGEPPSSVVCSPFEAPVLAAVAATAPPSSSTQSRRRSRKWKDKCFSIHGSVCDASSRTQREKLIEQVAFNSWVLDFRTRLEIQADSASANLRSRCPFFYEFSCKIAPIVSDRTISWFRILDYFDRRRDQLFDVGRLQGIGLLSAAYPRLQYLMTNW